VSKPRGPELDQSVSRTAPFGWTMTAFSEDRVVGHIVEALQRLGGLATLEEIEGQMSRSGAMRLPPDALDMVVRMTIRANRDGRGLGCFSQLDRDSIGLTTTRRPKPTALGQERRPELRQPGDAGRTSP
jgi:hypothetical protein